MLKSALLSKFRWMAGAVLLLATAASHAVDFKTVGANPAILYDAPSSKGGKLYVAPRVGRHVAVAASERQTAGMPDGFTRLSYRAGMRAHRHGDAGGPGVLARQCGKCGPRPGRA